MEHLPAPLPPDQKFPTEQLGSAGEKHAVDRPAQPPQPGARLRAGEDHYIPGRRPDHQLAGHRLGQILPELVGEQHAGFQPVEREHQRWRLSVDADPVQGRVEVGCGGAAQLLPRQAGGRQLRPGEQMSPVRRTG